MTRPAYHFSRVTLHPQGLAAADLSTLMQGHAYEEHRLLWRLFPGDGAARDFVFRAERQPAGLPRYYVVSARAPVAVPGLLEVQTHPAVYPPTVDEGTRLSLQLRANPTMARALPLSAEALAAYNSRREAAGKPARSARGRRVFDDVVMAAKKSLGHQPGRQPDATQLHQVEQAADQAARGWLLDHLAAWGLRVLQRHDDWTGEDRPAVAWDRYEQHRLRRKQGWIGFSSIDYRADVEVTDSAALQAALCQGVGRAKAFGCGLLLVAPLGR